MKEKIIQYLEEKKECKIRDLEKIVRPKSSKEFTEMVKSLNELEDEKLIYNDHTSLYLIDDIHFMAEVQKIFPDMKLLYLMKIIRCMFRKIKR